MIVMITILGAGGVISNDLAKLLVARKQPFRLVSRHQHAQRGAAETVFAELSDREQTVRAVAGSSVVYLLAGLKYDHKLWAEMWPKIMANTIEACKRAGAKLIFFDNVYMYGKVNGAMTEATPFNPCSRKGEVRAQIASALINQWQMGNLTAMIARSADFYGPHAKNGMGNVLAFDPLSKNKRAMCLADDSLPHSYTYTVDAAQALVTLAQSEQAWNQTWHVPTAPNPLTSKEFITRVAEELDVRPKYWVLKGPMVRLAGLFNPEVSEVHEMLYQNNAPYVFDSSKYAVTFGFSGTPYVESIRATAASYLKDGMADVSG
jgi:nucleoside-diphosphate-sugar epimerase